jgi:putative Holliday junction resolvase
MALDVGEARIGVAVCDPTGFLASPYTTIYVSRDEQQNWATIQKLLEETEAEAIVIGLPVSLDGQVHAQGRKVQLFAERLQAHISVPIVFWDERFSTVEAERLRGQKAGGKRQKRAGRGHAQSKRRQRGHEIDALAATVILQEYLSHVASSLQCPQTDLRDRENLTPSPTSPDVDNSNRAILNMSNGFALGNTTEEKSV